MEEEEEEEDQMAFSIWGSGLKTLSLCGTPVNKSELCFHFRGNNLFSFAQSTAQSCGPLSLRYNVRHWFFARN
jgi:hypothetical protein